MKFENITSEKWLSLKRKSIHTRVVNKQVENQERLNQIRSVIHQTMDEAVNDVNRIFAIVSAEQKQKEGDIVRAILKETWKNTDREMKATSQMLKDPKVCNRLIELGEKQGWIEKIAERKDEIKIPKTIGKFHAFIQKILGRTA